ncbi:hypothetical protein AB0465_15490 [Streptomyces griseoviridis]|uniref:hypothetical protein n=1 Tax=Streptomyces griseoviridis TaxID=45398 RepID=UPI00344E6EF9
MSHQQYPQQPGYGAPQYPPQPPKKSNVGKILGFGCLGFVGLFVLLGIVATVFGGTSGSDDSGSSSGSKPAAGAAENAEKPAEDDTNKNEGSEGDAEKGGGQDEKPSAAKVVTFKVWGSAPAGALGPLDITYGSDSDTREGAFKDGTFEATLPLKDDALYFHVMAQLQGSGDINCSVTFAGHTKKAHASGGYNICDAQVSSGLLGGWN